MLSVTVGVIDVVANGDAEASSTAVRPRVRGLRPCAPPAAPPWIGTVASPGRALCMLGCVSVTLRLLYRIVPWLRPALVHLTVT